MDNLKRNGVYLLIGLFFTAYLVARAIILPITIDEGGTYYNAVPRSFWDIVTYVDPSPNNHILNTLLIKFFVAIFGMHSLVLRLPNILAFVLYYFIIVSWMKRLGKDTLFVVFGIIVFTCNPYLLDFFALARGYALSIAFMFTSMYLVFLYFNSKNIKWIYYAFFAAVLAAYSNFTTLNFYISLLILCGIVLLQENWNKPVKILFKHYIVLIGISGLLVILCYWPLHQITSTGQLRYWSSNGFYNDTFIPLISAMQYGRNWFGQLDIRLFSLFIILLLMIVALFVFIKALKKRFNFSSDYFVFSFFVFIGVIVVILLQFYVFGTPFLNARGANFLYVLFIIPFVFCINIIYSKYYKRKYFVIGPFILLGAYHFINSINFYNCREWWFDGDTKHVLSYLETKHTDEEITLNTAWVYNTSFQFHIEEDEKSNIKLAPYHQELWPDSNYLYYYCERAQVVELEKNYSEVISFNRGNNVLMKKR